MNDNPLVVVEYYQPVFRYYIAASSDEIDNALVRCPTQFHLDYWNQFCSTRIFGGDEAWAAVKSYLSVLEARMEQVLNTHSVFFWLHMYRRIGVFLSQDHPGKTDANTLGLVRNIVESAIAKFGSLRRTGDVCLTHTVKLEEILGGHLLKVFSAHNSYSPFLDSLAITKQWVLTEWEPADLISMFGVEGFAYEYWRATALLRSIGKGASFEISPSKGFTELRSNSLNELICSYDARIVRYSSYLSSNKGITFFSNNSKEQQFNILAAAYNVGKTQTPQLYFADGGASNFVLSTIDLGTYIQNHAFMSASFKKRHGVSFESVCAFITSLSVNAGIKLTHFWVIWPK